MPIQMKRLSRSDPRYQDHEIKFYDSWCHPDKIANIKSIYLARDKDIARSHRGKRFIRYLNGGLYQRLYHGAQRACYIGESSDSLTLCHDDECSVCSVLRESFKLKYASERGMFGPGIYSTPTSSKADGYAMNHHVDSDLHAMLICYVAASKPEQKFEADPGKTRPSRGFDCVEGMTRDVGGDLEYPEYVVYREDAIIPVGLVMYTRKGWEPRY